MSTERLALPGIFGNEIAAVEAGLGAYTIASAGQLALSEPSARINQSLEAAALEKRNKQIFREVVDLLPTCSSIGPPTYVERARVESPRFGIVQSEGALHIAKQLQLNVVWLETHTFNETELQQIKLDPFFIIGKRFDPTNPEGEAQLLLMTARGVEVNAPNEIDTIVMNIGRKVVAEREKTVERLIDDETSLGNACSLIDGETATLAIGYDVPHSFIVAHNGSRHRPIGMRKYYRHVTGTVRFYSDYGAVYGLSNDAIDQYDVLHTVSRLVASFCVGNSVLGLINSWPDTDTAPDDMPENLSLASQEQLLRICLSVMEQNEAMRGHLAQILQTVGHMSLAEAEQHIAQEYPNIPNRLE